MNVYISNKPSNKPLDFRHHQRRRNTKLSSGHHIPPHILQTLPFTKAKARSTIGSTSRRRRPENGQKLKPHDVFWTWTISIQKRQSDNTTTAPTALLRATHIQPQRPSTGPPTSSQKSDLNRNLVFKMSATACTTIFCPSGDHVLHAGAVEVLSGFAEVSVHVALNLSEAE